MAAFLTPLRVEWVDPRTWRLLEALVYESDRLGRAITVPGGFCTDFASVPRLPLAYLVAGGRATRAAVVHDYLYQTHEEPRDVADDVFEEAACLGRARCDRAADGECGARVRRGGVRSGRGALRRAES